MLEGLVVKVNKFEQELQRLYRIEKIVREMFAEASCLGLFVGCGEDPKLHRDEQEGPLVKELKGLVANEVSIIR